MNIGECNNNKEFIDISIDEGIDVDDNYLNDINDNHLNDINDNHNLVNKTLNGSTYSLSRVINAYLSMPVLKKAQSLLLIPPQLVSDDEVAECHAVSLVHML